MIVPFLCALLSHPVPFPAPDECVPTAAEIARRDRWVAEHFPPPAAARPAPAVPPPPAPGLLVGTNYGPLVRNALSDRPLAIAGETFAHGIHTHAPSRVRVVLPGPGRDFSAVVGIQDSPSTGGSVVFSVEAGGKRLYASPIAVRGEAGRPVRVDLAGAGELVLAVSASGDHICSDQATWGNAAVLLADGRTIRLGDLPVHDPLSQPRAAAAPPFAFAYGDRPSDALLPAWELREESAPARPGTRARVRTARDPATGLQVRCTLVEYADFPTVEWSLSFANTGDRDTPLLAGILPLDTRFARDAPGDFLLHHFVGSPCQPNDYEPLETVIGPGAAKRIATQGGRPTNSNLPYLDLETGEGGLIAAVGWAGQWAAHFAREGAGELRATAGQEATSFTLHPGEEVRSPLVVLQFYDGDWHRAQNVWRRWMLAHNVPRRDGKLHPPFVFVCFGNYYPGLMTDAATELSFLRRYVAEGIHPDYWNQDAGWYPCAPVGWPLVGTREVDRSRWPQGLRQARSRQSRGGGGSLRRVEHVVAGLAGARAATGPGSRGVGVAPG
ncbi:MAG: NPCBM/NEW2 domain-containing protein, partial [Planctomycetota bacterium]